MRLLKKACTLLMMGVLLLSLVACDRESNVQVLDIPDIKPEYLSFFSNESTYASTTSADVTKYWTELFMQMYNKKVYISIDGASYYAEEGLSYRELLEKRMESSAPDDLYIINAEDVLAFEKKGYWLDLSGMDFVDNLSEAARYQSTYNGKVFSVPLSFTGYGFIWNMDMLNERGLSLPQNLAEFLDVCERLKNDGILPYGANKGYALTVPAMCAGFSELYQSEDQDKRIAALNSGETPVSSYIRNGYELLSLMIEKGYMDPEQALLSTPGKDDQALFAAGKCAFICAGMREWRKLVELPFQVQMTGLPVLPDGYASVYGADKRLCVNPNSEHMETVLQFIEMVGSAEALNKSAEIDAVMSSSNANNHAPSEVTQNLYTILTQPGQIPNQDFALHFNTWESIRDVARELCAGASVDEACAKLDEKQKADLTTFSAE